MSVEPSTAPGTPSVLRRLRGEGRRSDVADAVTIFAVGSLLLAIGLVDVAPGFDLWHGSAPPWGRLALLALGCLIVAVKRARPVLALLGGVAITLVDLSWGGSLAVLLVLWDLQFSAMLRCGARTRTWLWTVAGVLTVAAAVVAGEMTRDLRVVVFAALQLGAILLVPMWWADNVRQKTELADLERARADEAARTAELERERAADLARLAESQRQEAVQAERAAMARDLHDVIASHLSTIAIHSGAVLASPPDSDRDRAALTQVRASSLDSLREMRSMIDLLRTDAPRDPLAAPGRLAAIGSLVDSARQAGGDVRLEADLPDAEQVPAAVGQALHRIAQEALTNARKHAPAQPVRLRVDVDEGAGAVVLDVRSTLATTPAPLDEPALRAGTGLITMRERAHALGGTFTAGPTADGTWRVRADIPRTPQGLP
ncbi:histidine kinase [Isoptericola jiangsuensis]|uniref:sensor histidine kinase n=1 Tax=Isoptericola jiangsuensis TaxID=548579 RepID=UPI003AABC431